MWLSNFLNLLWPFLNSPTTTSSTTFRSSFGLNTRKRGGKVIVERKDWLVASSSNSTSSSTSSSTYLSISSSTSSSSSLSKARAPVKWQKEKSNHWSGGVPLSASWTSAKNPEDLVEPRNRKCTADQMYLSKMDLFKLLNEFVQNIWFCPGIRNAPRTHLLHAACNAFKAENCLPHLLYFKCLPMKQKLFLLIIFNSSIFHHPKLNCKANFDTKYQIKLQASYKSHDIHKTIYDEGARDQNYSQHGQLCHRIVTHMESHQFQLSFYTF